jgi:DNA-binding CsgD family transcriptional regulator
MLALLGTDSDANVAARLGVHRGSVLRMRRILGVPAFGPQAGKGHSWFNWTLDAQAMLGRMPDEAVAKRLGLSRGAVTAQREKLGVPSYRTRKPRIAWTKQTIALLGRIPDTQIARRLGISAISVSAQRARLGIAPVAGRGKLIVRNAELKRTLRLRTVEIHKKLGLAADTCRRLRKELGVPNPHPLHKWSDADIARLGTCSDAQLARELGVSKSSVQTARYSRGIASQRERTRNWTPARCALLGQIADTELARLMGLTVGAVTAKRRQLGIPRTARGRRSND